MIHLLSSIVLVSSSVAAAGIPSTRCSDASAGVRKIVQFPGMEAIEITLDQMGNKATIPTSELVVKESQINVIRETSTGAGAGQRGSSSKVYSAKLNVSKADGTSMPQAYTTNTKEDGSIEVDVICERSAY